MGMISKNEDSSGGGPNSLSSAGGCCPPLLDLLAFADDPRGIDAGRLAVLESHLEACGACAHQIEIASRRLNRAFLERLDEVDESENGDPRNRREADPDEPDSIWRKLFGPSMGRVRLAAALVAAAFLLAPALAIGLAADHYSDHSLALEGWAASFDLAARRAAGVVASVLPVLWLGARRSGWMSTPWLCAVGGLASTACAAIFSISTVDEYADAEILRRENLIQNHVWISYDSARYWPADQARRLGHPAQEPTADQIRQELTLLHDAGFDGLYLHECRDGMKDVPRIAREVGFGAILQGVRVADPKRLDAPETRRQIANAIAIKEYVDLYCLGELRAREVDLAALRQQLDRMRRATGKPIATSFLHNDYRGKRGDVLRSLEDFTVRALERPWKGGQADPATAVAAVRSAVESLREDAKPSLLTAVLYPDGGGEGFTEANQQLFFKEVLDLSLPRGTNLVFFNSFDRPWAARLARATDYTPAFEGHTGLFAVHQNEDGSLTFRPKAALSLWGRSRSSSASD